MSDPTSNSPQTDAATAALLSIGTWGASVYADVAIDSSSCSGSGSSPESRPPPSYPRWLVEGADIVANGGGDEQAKPIEQERLVETRRRKHRESMARLRHDKRTRIQQLETQMRCLQRHLERMLKLTARHRPDNDQDEEQQFRRHRVVAYAALVEETASLRHEQDSLEELVHLRKKFDRLLHNQSRRIEEDARLDLSGGMIPAYAAAATTAPLPLTGYWFQFLETEAPFFYECESLSTAASLIQEGLERVRTVKHTLASSNVHSVHCLGWQTERYISKDKDEPTARPLLLFRFSRRVPKSRTSLAELQCKTWQLLNSSELTGRLYGSTVVSKVVQRLSDDTIITLRNAPARTNHLRFRQFTVNSRLHSVDNNKGMVLVLSMDKEPRQEQLENEHLAEVVDRNSHSEKTVWLKNSSTCLEFSSVPESEWIEIECGGSMECASDDHANHLLIESCAALLRWEHLVVPPRLLSNEPIPGTGTVKQHIEHM